MGKKSTLLIIYGLSCHLSAIVVLIICITVKWSVLMQFIKGVGVWFFLSMFFIVFMGPLGQYFYMEAKNQKVHERLKEYESKCSWNIFQHRKK